MLLNNDIHLVACQKIFDRDNKFTLRVPAKGLAYVTWPDLTVYFVMADTEQRAQYLSPATIV